jgi:hypothetical protein
VRCGETATACFRIESESPWKHGRTRRFEGALCADL